MKVVLFGATGMVGQGALRECLLDPEVERVLVVTRNPTGAVHEKLREVVRADLADLSPLEDELTGYDVCLFCLGISSMGMTEEAYTRVTHDLALAAAQILVRRNPGMTFLFVSGAGTDSSERGRSMWARVKGKTENALLALPFKSAYMLRPGFIQPLHGITSRTRLYRTLYIIIRPLVPVLRALFPRSVITTEQLGRAMLEIVKHGAPRAVLEARDLIDLGRAGPVRATGRDAG